MFQFDLSNVHLKTNRYTPSGRLAVLLYEGDEPCATASVCIPGAILAEDEFLFKTYSENEGLMEAILRGMIEETGRYFECA